jgi:hypothetical protein
MGQAAMPSLQPDPKSGPIAGNAKRPYSARYPQTGYPLYLNTFSMPVERPFIEMLL